VILEMMITVIMLIYIASNALQLPSCVIIHNQCSNVELVSPVYFGNDTAYLKLSDQQINIGTEVKIRFEIYTTRDEFKGALLFKLQGYSNSQYDMNTSITEIDKNETKYVQMLVFWGIKDTKLSLYAALTEHAEEFTWSEDALRKLYYENRDWLKEYDDTISDTWLVNDNMTLKTTLNTEDLKRAFELSVSISEEKKDDYAMRPLYIDLTRWVTLDMSIFHVLIYIVRFALQSPVSLNIHNQCQDINLTSLVYFMHRGKWHVEPDKEVDVNSVIRNRIEFDSEQGMMEGALAYKIQRWQHVEPDELIQDKLKGVHLLVAWRGERTKGLNVHVLLVEHDREFDKDKLKMLHQKYWHSLDTWFNTIRSYRLSDDATILTTTVKVMNGGYRWDIFITKKENDQYIMEPPRIDAER
jgi:hypothetical protein